MSAGSTSHGGARGGATNASGKSARAAASKARADRIDAALKAAADPNDLSSR